VALDGGIFLLPLTMWCLPFVFLVERSPLAP